jgi:hypothetical protein
VVLGLVFSGGSGGSTARRPSVDFSALPFLQTGPPPWKSASDSLPGRMPFLGLSALSQEELAFHIHQHLDLYLNGKRVVLPAGIGIAANSSSPFITEVHTHDTSGIIHVESATKRDFTLGQLFGEWGVRLTANCLGRYCMGVHWWVNGKPQVGNPATLVLRSHQEIVIAAGKPPSSIPTSYSFPAGY